MRWLTGIVGILATIGCARSVSGTQGDGGASDARVSLDAAPSMDAVRACPELDAPDLTREGVATQGALVVTARVDTREDLYAAMPLPANACVRVPRVRARAFWYVPEADGAVFARFSGGALEVLGGCDEGFALRLCGDGWTPPLRQGRPVLLVVSDGANDPQGLRPGVVGALEVLRARPLDDGERCVGPSGDAPRLCGPGLRCEGTHCAPDPSAATPCDATSDPCPSGQRCSPLGRCATALPAEAPCTRASVCAEGLQCVQSALGEGRCRPLRALGEPCGTPYDHGSCASGLACSATGLCEPPRVFAPLGGRCGERPCVSGARCDAGVCRSLDVRPYGPCDFGDALGCPDGYSCVVGRCLPGSATEGASCDRALGPGCARGTVCSHRGVCEVPGPEGFACDSDDGCDEGLQCAGPQRICGHLGSPWHPCRESAPRCDQGERCINDLCRPPVAPDACESGSGEPVPCGVDRSCRGGSCRDDGATGTWCRRGASALSRGECDEGARCVLGVCQRSEPLGSCGSDEACGPGRSCTRTPTSQGTCAPIGSDGAECRVQGARWTCDAGLQCERGRCRPALAGGGVCAVTQTACAVGERCDRGVCARDGAPAGRCRDGEGGCDPGLVCLGYGANRYCTALSPLDAPCDNAARTCAPGLTCGADARCVPDGRLGAFCRVGVSPCDAPNFCRAGRCAPPLAEGEGCESSSQCRDPLRCVNARCGPAVSLGVLTAPCRASSPYCDAGLACLHGLCQRRVGEGERCGASAPGTLCGPDLSCEQDSCARMGVLGGPCRGAAPACDGDAVCANGRCYAPSETGALCHEPGAVCAPEHHCILEAPTPRCLRDGGREALCRLDGSELCDPGLRCQTPTLRCWPRTN